MRTSGRCPARPSRAGPPPRAGADSLSPAADSLLAQHSFAIPQPPSETPILRQEPGASVRNLEPPSGTWSLRQEPGAVVRNLEPPSGTWSLRREPGDSVGNLETPSGTWRLRRKSGAFVGKLETPSENWSLRGKPGDSVRKLKPSWEMPRAFVPNSEAHSPAAIPPLANRLARGSNAP
jgi:hypothetical protein